MQDNNFPQEFLEIYQKANEETKLKLALMEYLHVKNLLGGLIEAIRRTEKENWHGKQE